MTRVGGLLTEYVMLVGLERQLDLVRPIPGPAVAPAAAAMPAPVVSNAGS